MPVNAAEPFQFSLPSEPVAAPGEVRATWSQGEWKINITPPNEDGHEEFNFRDFSSLKRAIDIAEKQYRFDSRVRTRQPEITKGELANV